MPELGMKHLGIGVVLIVIVGVFLTTQSGVAGIWSTGSMDMGDANCSVTLGVIGLDADGNEVTAPISNNPLYLEGVEISSVKFTVSIIASGSDVDWSTLEVKFTVTSEGVQASGLVTWTIMDFTLQGDGTYKASDEYVVDEYLDQLTYDEPDYTESDGTDVYIYDVQAVVNGYVTDLKDNSLTASVTITANFELRTAPDGTFSLKAG